MTDAPSPDTAIALRPQHAFPPTRLSAFEDPADEKSSHRSQRYSSLVDFYRDRRPSWYDSATREFAGFERVLDLGCGPGLALDALASHGVREPIGVDRWQGFLEDGRAAGRRVILHDLTLPMPFFRSASFQGVFSHFALDYMSPIGVNQVLLEARRLLAPGGLMVLYMAGAGLALGDPARTSPYDETAITRLLEATGFDDFDIEHTQGRRNTVVRARGVERDPDVVGMANGTMLEYQADGEVQVTAGISSMRPVEGELAIEVSDGKRCIGSRPRLPSLLPADDGAIAGMAVCGRVVAVGTGEFELQSWLWQGSEPLMVDALRTQLTPELIRLRIQADGGTLEPQTEWRPQPPMLEVPSNAYTPVVNASSDQPGDEWHARGRQVIVEREGDDPELFRAAAESEDHFLVRRAPLAVATLEREWKGKRLQGVVLDLEAALRPEALELLLWAGYRGALVYIEPESWAALEAALQELPSSLACPLLVVDPALSGRSADDPDGPLRGPIATALDAIPPLHVVLATSTATAATALCERYPTRVLIGELGGGVVAGDGPLVRDATETLRYLTERTTLMFLRSISGRSGSELGRLTA